MHACYYYPYQHHHHRLTKKERNLERRISRKIYIGNIPGPTWLEQSVFFYLFYQKTALKNVCISLWRTLRKNVFNSKSRTSTPHSIHMLLHNYQYNRVEIKGFPTVVSVEKRIGAFSPFHLILFKEKWVFITVPYYYDFIIMRESKKSACFPFSQKRISFLQWWVITKTKTYWKTYKCSPNYNATYKTKHCRLHPVLGSRITTSLAFSSCVVHNLSGIISHQLRS